MGIKNVGIFDLENREIDGKNSTKPFGLLRDITNSSTKF